MKRLGVLAKGGTVGVLCHVQEHHTITQPGSLTM